MISDSLLQGVYLFADLSADERASLAKIAEEMNLPAGFPIFSAGDRATDVARAAEEAGFIQAAQSAAEAAVTEVVRQLAKAEIKDGVRDDGAAAHAQHLVQHALGVAHRLQRLRQDHEVEGAVLEVRQAAVAAAT